MFFVINLQAEAVHARSANFNTLNW